jgi:putative oxidoreductase
MARLTSVQPYVRSILRIVTAATFSLHGLQKVLGMFGGMPGKGGPAAMATLPWIAGCLELGGGVLLVLGLFTVPVAFILSGEMAVAYFMMHFPRGFYPIHNGGELAVLYCFIFLYLCVAGPGPLSLDALFRKKG